MANQLNERSQLLLKTLIEYYITEGQPVGSTTLVKRSRLELSSATIRNVIADLERLGLVKSPHTSAGRIPTAKGYRMFLDNLLTVKPLNEQEVRNIQRSIDQESDTQHLIESTSSLLSGITKMAGVVMLPEHELTKLRQIEFLPLSDRRVLAILVFSDNEVRNRIINTDRAYSNDDLQRISNCLNKEFLALGKEINQIRDELVQQMKEARASMDQIMLQAIELGQQVFTSAESKPHDYVLAGETNLMQYEDMADINRLRQLFEAFNEKQRILQLLDQSIKAPGVQIFVGTESGYEFLDDCSVVTATYTDDEGIIGALGVIGPTRMAYDRVIPLVDVTAKILGTVLKQRR